MMPRHSYGTYALVILASPVLLAAGEPLMKWALARERSRRQMVPGNGNGNGNGNGGGSRGGFIPVDPNRRLPTVHAFFFNPLAIALTAPSRWAGDQLRKRRRPA